MTPEELQTLLNEPALARPDGVPPGTLNQGNHSIGYGVIISSCVLSLVAVITRLASRISMKRLGIEDALVVCALGFSAGEAYVMYETSIFPGLLIHQWDLQLKHVPRLLYFIYIDSIFYNLTVMFLKIAILIDWLKLFVPKGQRNWLFWTFHVLICANILYYGSETLIQISRCIPRETTWSPLYDGDTCKVREFTDIASGIINIVSDLAILILPQWVIWNLHASKSKRIGVSPLFFVGFFACIFAALRIVSIAGQMRSWDATWYISYILLFNLGEVTGGFLVIGIPSIPIAVRLLPFSDSMISFVKSFGHAKKEKTNLNIRSWPKPTPRKRHDQWGMTELNTYDLMTTTSISSTAERSAVVNQEEAGSLA